MNSCIFNLRPADPRYQVLVNNIVRMAGLDYQIQVYASDTPNACATLYKNCSMEFQKPIISYNPKFIRQIEQQSAWAVAAIFAHEVAHHYNQDLYGKYIANLFGTSAKYQAHRKELNADQFAGWILRHKGATLSQALKLYELIPFEESQTHPAKLKRQQAMIEGWKEANFRLTPPVPKKSSDMKNAVLWGLGAIALFGLGAAVLGGGKQPN